MGHFVLYAYFLLKLDPRDKMYWGKQKTCPFPRGTRRSHVPFDDPTSHDCLMSSFCLSPHLIQRLICDHRLFAFSTVNAWQHINDRMVHISRWCWPLITQGRSHTTLQHTTSICWAVHTHRSLISYMAAGETIITQMSCTSCVLHIIHNCYSF